MRVLSLSFVTVTIAVAHMIARTRGKDHKGALKFKLAVLARKCVK
jgi:hypothetical protein